MTPAEAYERACRLKDYQVFSTNEARKIIAGLLTCIDALTKEAIELRKEKEAA